MGAARWVEAVLVWPARCARRRLRDRGFSEREATRGLDQSGIWSLVTGNWQLVTRTYSLLVRRLLLLANPSASGPHAHKYWLQEQPGKLIVVDPVRTPTADLADIHLRPYPGSDAALAFAMMHVIKHEGLLDDVFIAAHTLGFDELAPSLDACTPEWGEAKTGVAAKDIEAAARVYAAGPSILWLGQALQRQHRGVAGEKRVLGAVDHQERARANATDVVCRTGCRHVALRPR